MKTDLKTLYKIFGLVENHSLVLNVSKEQFITLLAPHVGHDGNSSMDIFATKTDYKGVVGQSGFYLRRRRGLWKHNRHFTKVIGTFREENNQLILDLEFKNFPPPVWGFLFLIFFFGLGSVIIFLSALLSFNFDTISRAFFNVFYMVVLTVILGMIVRSFSTKTIQTMKFELENNFNAYLTRKV